MSGYFFNGVNISDLIQSGTTSAPPSNVYTGFPTSTAPTYKTTGLDKPYNFSFLYNGSDVSNYATAYGIGFNAGTSGAIPTSIPGAPGYSFKHISGYCWGGGGGGGGGGGKNSGSYGGGDGGTGGNGAFAAIVDYPISGSTVNYQSGGAGNGGSGHGSNKGDSGNSGGDSFINIGATTILFANGGGGGGGGNTANVNSGGNGSGGFTAGYTGTTANTSPATSYPNNPSNGGAGGNASFNSGVNSGGDGSPGYLYVYLTYQS